MDPDFEQQLVDRTVNIEMENLEAGAYANKIMQPQPLHLVVGLHVNTKGSSSLDKEPATDCLDVLSYVLFLPCVVTKSLADTLNKINKGMLPIGRRRELAGPEPEVAHCSANDADTFHPVQFFEGFSSYFGSLRVGTCSLDTAFTFATVPKRSDYGTMAVPLGAAAKFQLLHVAGVALYFVAGPCNMFHRG